MAHSFRSFRPAACLALAACLLASPATADLSAFVAAVGFDEDANLDGSPGIGLRWGRSSGIFGGETSLLIARPERSAEGIAGKSATAIFYEGRFLVNIPVGSLKPFVGIGLGAITITGTKLARPENAADATLQALNAFDDLSTNQAFSYGAGARYALNERIDARVDLRQYQVFSVRGAIAREAAEQVGDQAGGQVGELARDLVPKEKTVQYSELSAGVVFRF